MLLLSQLVMSLDGCAKCGEVHGCNCSYKEYLGGREPSPRILPWNGQEWQPWDEYVAELKVKNVLCGKMGRIIDA